jgi:hypothetical protein
MNPRDEPTPDLARVQRWLQAVITHPAGVEQGISSAQAREQIDVAADNLESVIERSRNLTSAERLEIYASAYYSRLIECLGSEFPAMRHALGQETFDSFAFDYLQAYPSRSYTLSDLSADFPRFLADTRPVDEDDTGGSPSWPDFLIDLARLERIYSEVFDAPGPENLPTLSLADLSAIPADGWTSSRLIPAAGLRLVTLHFPVHEYISAARRGEDPAPPAPSPTWLVVTRREYIVRRHSVSAPEFAVLESLIAGQTIGEAIVTALEQATLDVGALENTLHQWFASWASGGFFQGLVAGGEE